MSDDSNQPMPAAAEEKKKRASPKESGIPSGSISAPSAGGSTKRQRYAAWILVLLVILISVLLGRFSSAAALWTAVRILIVSLIGFHCVAVLTADCTRSWRCAGYPLALTGFMAILTALANIQETARLAPLNGAIADRKVAYDALIYSLKAVIENDCHPKAARALMYRPSPEPYAGACERVEHFLPQIEFSAAAESKVEGLNSGEGWGLDIITPDSPTGAWLGLYNDAARFNESVKRTQKVLEESRKTPESPIARWAANGAVKYWYFVLAFFLGLQLSKISAELLTPKTGEETPCEALAKFVSEALAKAKLFWRRPKPSAS